MVLSLSLSLLECSLAKHWILLRWRRSTCTPPFSQCSPACSAPVASSWGRNWSVFALFCPHQPHAPIYSRKYSYSLDKNWFVIALVLLALSVTRMSNKHCASSSCILYSLSFLSEYSFDSFEIICSCPVSLIHLVLTQVLIFIPIFNLLFTHSLQVLIRWSTSSPSWRTCTRG